MFRAEDRDRVQDHVLALASSDSRVVAAAVVGALAHGDGDRWSDLDLTFGVDDVVPAVEVLDDWTRELAAAFEAAHLFDLPVGSTIYRVFLFPGLLQVDLSFTPASEFGARGPKFRLLFGNADEDVTAPPVSPEHQFGLAVHHAVRARFCIERCRWWQAEYWISGLRDEALGLACRRLGLPSTQGRGFDQLPADVRDPFDAGLVRSLEREELLRALAVAVTGLLRESVEVPGVAASVEAQLRGLASA
jgi:hypothetical protein